MKYVFDIDGTICTNSNGNYNNARPMQHRINVVNKLYDEGHTIIFQTARGMGRTNDNQLSAYALFYDFTTQQLNNWGVKYHALFLGKPSGDIYIDDKGTNEIDFFNLDNNSSSEKQSEELGS